VMGVAAVLVALGGVVFVVLAISKMFGFADKRRSDGSTVNGTLARWALALLVSGALVAWLLGKPGK
jgi:hypothetical protein